MLANNHTMPWCSCGLVHLGVAFTPAGAPTQGVQSRPSSCTRSCIARTPCSFCACLCPCLLGARLPNVAQVEDAPHAHPWPCPLGLCGFAPSWHSALRSSCPCLPTLAAPGFTRPSRLREARRHHWLFAQDKNVQSSTQPQPTVMAAPCLASSTAKARLSQGCWHSCHRWAVSPVPVAPRGYGMPFRSSRIQPFPEPKGHLSPLISLWGTNSPPPKPSSQQKGEGGAAGLWRSVLQLWGRQSTGSKGAGLSRTHLFSSCPWVAGTLGGEKDPLPHPRRPPVLNSQFCLEPCEAEMGKVAFTSCSPMEPARECPATLWGAAQRIQSSLMPGAASTPLLSLGGRGLGKEPPQLPLHGGKWAS